MDFKEMNVREVYEYLKENKLYPNDISEPCFSMGKTMENVAYDIEIEGDWKHDHGYLEYLMAERGYYQTRKQTIEDGDSNFYTAVHRFVAKPYYELFNGKRK